MYSQRFALPFLLAGFVALAIAYSIVTPLGEASDEVPHFAYVEYLVARHQLPAAEGVFLGEAHQPPLYYMIGALFTFWVPRQDFSIIANPDFVLHDPHTPNLLLHTRREEFPFRDDTLAWHLVRLLSISMGAVTVWATWRIALVLFPDNFFLALGSAAFVALLPSFLFLSASVNNDNAVILLCALSTLRLVSMARGSLKWHKSASLGVLMGLAVLAKGSGLIVMPFSAAVFLHLAIKSRAWKETAIHVVISFGVAGAILTPWSIANLIQSGNPLGSALALTPEWLRQTPMSVPDWIDFTQSMYTSFWGRFGGAAQLEMAPLVYGVVGLTAIPVVLGWVAYARDTLERKLDCNALALFALFSVFWLVLLASFVRWTLNYVGTNQIRLVFPGLPLLAIISIAGLARFFAARIHIAVTAWIGGAVLLNVAALFYLQSLFFPPPLNLANLPSLDNAAPADFAGAIRIVDYKVDQVRVSPGDPVTVQVYWQALTNGDADYWLLLQLIGRDGVIINQDGVPASGRLTTDWWSKGQVFASRHTLIVPKDITPGTYTLRLGLHPFGTWDWLPVDNRDMLDLAKITVN